MVSVVSVQSSLASESDDIRALIEVPVIVSPPSAGDSESCFSLVNNETNTFLKSDVSKSFVEIWGGHLICNYSDRFNN